LLKTIISTSSSNFDFFLSINLFVAFIFIEGPKVEIVYKVFCQIFHCIYMTIGWWTFYWAFRQGEDFFILFFFSVPLWMIASPRYCNESFLAFSLLFFLTSQPFLDPYNVTYLYIYYPCKKFFPFIFIHFSKTTINIIWLPFITWNHY
jgi:hypothetical protein